MTCSIVGWYGTETMGDKAIFDGILRILSTIGLEEVLIGSLYPFYSERSLYEEKDVIALSAPNVKFTVFDAKRPTEIREKLKNCDLIIFGGGPLMDLEELYLIRYMFEYANQLKIPTILCGIGVGPLKNQKYINVVKDILSACDLIILRDNISKDELLRIYGDDYGSIVLPDPAIISIEEFLISHSRDEKNYRVVNLRDYMESVYNHRLFENRETWVDFLLNVSKDVDKLYFTPMHNFYIGEDDRYCIAELLNGEKINKLEILDRPFDLYTLYDKILNAQGCIGMRYHSVVMQTLLNGNNLIIDYTGVENGKIFGFLNDLENGVCLLNRRYALQSGEELKIDKFANKLRENYRYKYNYQNVKKEYLDAFRERNLLG